MVGVTLRRYGGMKTAVLFLVGLVVCACMVQSGYAADTKTVDVAASIPQQNGLTVTVSRVVGTTWTNATSIDFGALVYNGTNSVFTANPYYAIDVGVNSNAADWTVTHKTASISNPAGTDNLDKNINVNFVRQTGNTTAVALSKVTFANSNNKAFTRSQLTGGWLRIYYGIATGNTTSDAPGAVPINATKPYGDYKGSVTLTLTP